MEQIRGKPLAKACALAFVAGAILVGPLDFFHTWTGVQSYLGQNRFSVTRVNWPWYVPLQMGLVGAVLAAAWSFLRLCVLEPLSGTERQSGSGSKMLMLVAVSLVALCYFLAYVLLDTNHYTSWFVLLFGCFLIGLNLFASRQHVLAFLFIGLAGPFAEWVLLDPGIGYYVFRNNDWFGRSSSWLLPAYGWVGVFIHELTREVGEHKSPL